MANTASADTAPSEPQARRVVYCGVCSLPPEYCEYGGTAKKCEEWLEQNHGEMHDRLYSEEALSAALSTLSASAQARAEKDAAKKTAKAQAQEARAASTKAASVITIKRIERNKRKYVTAVHGLEAHGMDLKKVAKDWGKKFATGSSVSKVPGGGEEIVVQGDVGGEVFDVLVEGMGLPEGNVEMVEGGKGGR